MEYKIPYKKDLKFKSAEEVNEEKQREMEENLQRDIEYFQKKISSMIQYTSTDTSRRYIVYNLDEIKEHTRNKTKQDKILKQLQLELTDKGYTNYVTKVKFDGKVLVVLLDDNTKGEVNKYVKTKNEFNIKTMFAISLVLLLGIICTVGVLTI